LLSNQWIHNLSPRLLQASQSADFISAHQARAARDIIREDRRQFELGANS